MTDLFTNRQSHDNYQVTIYGQLCCHLSPCRHVHHGMLGMRHENGRPVCVLYSETDYEDPSSQGAIVNFNILRADGSFVGYSEVCIQFHNSMSEWAGLHHNSVALAMSAKLRNPCTYFQPRACSQTASMASWVGVSCPVCRSLLV